MAFTIACTLHGILYGQECAMVRHYHSPSAASLPDPADFCTELTEGWQDYMNDNFGVAMQWTGWSIREEVLGAVGASYTPPTWPLSGGDVGAAVPSFNAIGVVLRGAPGTKPPRGFARLPGGLLAQVTQNRWQTAYRNLLQAGAAIYYAIAPTTAGGAGAWIPIIYSRKFGTFNPITSVTVSEYLYHQNSRHVGHGG